MKKKVIVFLAAAMSLGITITEPLNVKAYERELQESVTQNQFASMIDEILQIKEAHPEFTEKEIKEKMDGMHKTSGKER